MTVQSDLQKQKVERLAKSQGITAAEYKRRCEINTAKNKGLTPAEYAKKKISDSAEKKEITAAEYRKMCAEKSARNKGFRSRKEYDRAWHRAKVLHISFEQYCHTLEKDENGFFILHDFKRKNQQHSFLLSRLNWLMQNCW